MATTVEIQYEELIDLRRERTLFRTLHRKARGREDRLKAEVGQLRREGKKFKKKVEQRAGELTRRIKGLQRELRRQAKDLGSRIKELRAEVEELEAENEELKATVARQARRLYGRSTEQSGDRHSAQHRAEDPPGRQKQDRAPDESDGPEQPRSRGQQPGAEGHGRRPRPELPTVETVHEVPPEDRLCPVCGEPYYESSLTEDSSQVEVEVIVRRHIHRRKRYLQGCHCEGVPLSVVAPKAGKIIPKGLLHHSVWTYILLEKWLHQRPLGRVLDVLELKGLDISQGTITGGLRRILPMLRPLYRRIMERNRSAGRWKMDETSWRTYVPVEGKDGHQWWLWVVVTDDTVAYLLEPTRAGKVPRDHLGPDAKGIALVDRLSAYGKLPEGVVRAFCWAHVRRDFVEVEDFYGPAEKKWAREWIDRIARLYELNAERAGAWGEEEAFAQKDRLLREAVEEMERIREEQLADPTLHEKCHKVLESLRNHWDGCTVFVEHPEVPMDNNESERWLRRPACGRKNYYGCGSEWSADLTAILFSIFATLEKNDINPEKWLSAYLATCAEAGGEAPEGEELEAFLPWILPEDRREKWKLKEKPNEHISPATTGESAPRGSPIQREGLQPGGDPLHAQTDQLGARAVPGGAVAAGV